MSITRQTSLPLSDEQCRTLVDSLVEGLMIADESQKIIVINPALARILGVSAADILGHHSSEFMDDVARVSMLGEIEAGNACHAQTCAPTKLREDGTPLPARVSSWPTFDRGRRPSGYVRGVSDLSEQKSVQTMRDQLARIVESSNHGIIGRDSNGIVTSWNEGAEEIYGNTSAEIVGRNIDFLAAPDRPDEVAQFVSRVRDGEQVAHYETDRTTKDGRRIDVALTLSRASYNAPRPSVSAAWVRSSIPRFSELHSTAFFWSMPRRKLSPTTSGSVRRWNAPLATSTINRLQRQ